MMSSVRDLNSRQRTIAASWRSLLWVFAKREWVSLFVASATGLLAAEVFHLFWSDQAFQSSLVSKYRPSWLSFDNPHYYLPYFAIVLLSLLLSAALIGPIKILRGLKS
jgi:hypothetical protein